MEKTQFNSLEELSDFLSRIVATNPRCKAGYCNGTRGWYAINVLVSNSKERVYSVNICCGRIGKTDIQRTEERLVAIIGESETRLGSFVNDYMRIVYSRTFFGFFHIQYTHVRDYLLKLKGKLFHAKLGIEKSEGSGVKELDKPASSNDGGNGNALQEGGERKQVDK